MIPYELQDLYKQIVRRGIDEMGIPFRLCIDDWMKLRDLADEWCRKNDRPLLSSAEVERPNFIWGGVPVTAE